MQVFVHVMSRLYCCSRDASLPDRNGRRRGKTGEKNKRVHHVK